MACGVFFALCFLHLVPHSVHSWKEVFTPENSTKVPEMDHGREQHSYSDILGPFLILFSFTIMLFIEKNDMICQHKSFENLPIIVLTRVSV